MHTTSHRENKHTRTARLFGALASLGLSYDEADTLRLAEKTLHRWHELECGDGNDHASWSIERDETTGKPFMVTYYNNRTGDNQTTRRRIADREAGALKRIRGIIDAHPGLWFYQQGDPRGCALYVGRKSDIPAGSALDSCYSRGIGCCID